MSIEISTRVWKQSKQKGTHKLFLLALADHANGDGYCYPGIERISEWCNVNERQGRRISADLQTDGEILVKVGGGRFGTNEYIITAGMGSDELEKTIVKYFKVSKKDAYEMVQDLLKRQYDAANTPPENPVLETPPVMQDQNPVMQGRNPVLEDRGTVINRQEPNNNKSLANMDSLQAGCWQELATLLVAYSPITVEKFCEIWSRHPDIRRHKFALEQTRIYANPVSFRYYETTFLRYDPEKVRPTKPAAPVNGKTWDQMVIYD